ncbi:sulfide/dihydroorotate dehydrogenase-like FAD/NAD-binding protein, partial [bacterium]
NTLILDGTGMCGCCRVRIGGKMKFTCVDGPEFDAHLVDWDELEKRSKMYETKEKHICRLYDKECS